MSILKRFLITVFLILGLINFSFAETQINLADCKKQLIAYHDSGEYYQNIASVVKEARDYLQFRLTQNARAKNPQKLALVLDIDETSLSNYPDMVKLDFGGTLKEINQLEGEGHDPAIPATLSLYQFAQANGVAVIFITGRDESERAKTTANLKEVGYHNWTALYLRSKAQQGLSAEAYKTALRKQIEAQGYDIAVNMGDQYSDLSGGYADMGFKLPNPYYFVK